MRYLTLSFGYAMLKSSLLEGIHMRSLTLAAVAAVLFSAPCASAHEPRHPYPALPLPTCHNVGGQLVGNCAFRQFGGYGYPPFYQNGVPSILDPRIACSLKNPCVLWGIPSHGRHPPIGWSFIIGGRF